MFRVETCYIPQCAGEKCSGPRDFDEYVPHFPTEADARGHMVDAEWRFTDDGRALCERCVDKADCAERGSHVYTGEWRDAHDRRGSTATPGRRFRVCEHCASIDYEPAGIDRTSPPT